MVSQQFNPASLLRALPALLAAGCSSDESAKTVGHGTPGVDLLPGPTATEPSFSPPCWLKSDPRHWFRGTWSCCPGPSPHACTVTAVEVPQSIGTLFTISGLCKLRVIVLHLDILGFCRICRQTTTHMSGAGGHPILSLPTR